MAGPLQGNRLHPRVEWSPLHHVTRPSGRRNNQDRAPGGDGYRRNWMPRDAQTDAYEFLWINVNKKSVALNLKTKPAIELARKLIAGADVLVENYQRGIMERFGLDYESVRSLNPRLIYACSRGYGEWGPYADYGKTAATNNSIAGWTHSAWEDR